MKRVIFGKGSISTDLGILILRVIAGVSIITHGWPKFQNIINGDMQFGDPVGIGPEASLVLAAFAEFVCAVLVILGLATRFATIPIIITMIVAFFIVHAADDFGTKEMALLYLTMFLTIFLTGPGKYSVDRAL